MRRNALWLLRSTRLVRADLERRGQPIGPLDMQIAAHALSSSAIEVANNEWEFRKFVGLTVENCTL